MWILLSPFLMIGSLKSSLVPTDSRFTSSTTLLVFVSVWRSYLGRLPSSCCAFCESPRVTHKRRDKGMRKSPSMVLLGRMCISKPTSTAAPRTHGRPNAYGEVPFFLRHGRDRDVRR